MSKRFISFSALVFGTVGAFVPYWFGDKNLIDIWQILTSFAGGIFGIWLAVQLSKRWG